MSERLREVHGCIHDKSLNGRIRRLLCAIMGCRPIPTMSFESAQINIRCGRCYAAYGYVFEDGKWGPLVGKVVSK